MITISVGGFFAKETLKLVENLPARKMLLTSNGNEKFRESYDKVYYMSSEEAGRNRSVYHMFGIEYCLEIIYLEYYKRFLK